jgi:hypothetical protein
MLRFFLVLLLIPAGVYAQKDPLTLNWSEKWDFSDELSPVSIRVDPRGNVYSAANVMAERNANILLMKYAENKTLLWTREFDNGDNEAVSDMIVRGNAIYLGGLSNNLLLLLKYNGSGELTWAKYADVDAKGLPSIDVDAKYVYIALGNWVIRYDKISGEVSHTFKLDDNMIFHAIDIYGKNLYLAGQPLDSSHMIIQKYDLKGGMVWNVTRVSKWAEGARDIMLYRDMLYIVGIQGNVIVEKDAMKGIADFLLLKYDTNGKMVWEKMGGTNSTLEWGFGGRVYSGALYVIGVHSSDYMVNGTSTVLQKYDLDGEMEWSSAREEVMRGVSLDVRGNRIFLAGSSQGNIIIQELNSD